MVDILIAGTLSAVIIVQTFLHKQERKDLYNRIMSRDMQEYQRVTDGVSEAEREKRKAEGSNLLKRRIQSARVGMHGDFKGE